MCECHGFQPGRIRKEPIMFVDLRSRDLELNPSADQLYKNVQDEIGRCFGDFSSGEGLEMELNVSACRRQ